jgi:hypothetical protein
LMNKLKGCGRILIEPLSIFVAFAALTNETKSYEVKFVPRDPVLD